MWPMPRPILAPSSKRSITPSGCTPVSDTCLPQSSRRARPLRPLTYRQKPDSSLCPVNGVHSSRTRTYMHAAGVLQTLAHSSRQRARMTHALIAIVALHEHAPFFEIVVRKGSRWDSNPRETGPQPAAWSARLRPPQMEVERLELSAYGVQSRRAPGCATPPRICYGDGRNRTDNTYRARVHRYPLGHAPPEYGIGGTRTRKSLHAASVLRSRLRHDPVLHRYFPLVLCRRGVFHPFTMSSVHPLITSGGTRNRTLS